MSLRAKNILLVISGGIAAYKSLELIRLLRKGGADVRCVLTQGGAQFVTPLSVSALSENPVYTDLWSLKDESEMGHIRLSREADLIVVAPASANMIAKMAQGLADDLASTALLAADKDIVIVPAMNHMMWLNAATQANIDTLKQRGVIIAGPIDGDMACGEYGPGRMIEAAEILSVIDNYFSQKPLSGFSAVVTSGPTYEPLDPVRFIGNRSSGKQGHAIAQALADAGADVTLVSGPVALPDPAGVTVVHVETADQMLKATLQALPADIGVFAAAVADWRPDQAATQKMKKRAGGDAPSLTLVENPDILKTVSGHKTLRPRLVVGFAAETAESNQALEKLGVSKLSAKGCDWIVANRVIQGETPVFGADENAVTLIKNTGVESWAPSTKQAVAAKLVTCIIDQFAKDKNHDEASAAAE